MACIICVATSLLKLLEVEMEKRFLQNETKSIPTRSSMQHKDKRSLKIIRSSVLNLSWLMIVYVGLCVACVAEFNRKSPPKLFQMPSEAAASPGTNVQGKKPLLEHDRGTRCSRFLSAVFQCIKVHINALCNHI